MVWNALHHNNGNSFYMSKLFGLVYCKECDECRPVHACFTHVRKHLGAKLFQELGFETILQEEFKNTPWEGLVPNLEATKESIKLYLQSNPKIPMLQIESGYFVCQETGCDQCFSNQKGLTVHLKTFHKGKCN